MRGIKFRAWDNKAKKWVTEYWYIDRDGTVCNQYDTDIGVVFVVIQFTGLCDWRGVPIFEGDKVMATYKEDGDEVSSPGVVEWYDREAMYGIRLGDSEGDRELWGVVKFRVLEVVGNICENSELLK